MRETQVLIIGGGPIGLMGSLLLSRLGIKSIVADLRGRTSTHPRSRLVDAPTLEMMREIGVEQEIIASGLGPDWTEYNRWFDALAKTEICKIYSPSFHTVKTDISSSVPVMTSQDYVEAVLYDKARQDPNVDLRFNTTVHALRQEKTGVSALLKKNDAPEEEHVMASYAIGADGVRSSTRAVIGTALNADFMDIFFQDVIFEADLSKYTHGKQGGLLFIAHKQGGSVFQPLDGKRRWRCQIGGFDRVNRKMTPEIAAQWVNSAVGAKENIPIKVKTMTEWQFMPGRAGKLGKGRIFLAGDAAHVFIPTGALGNNTGFVGIRNLCWKLAFVLKGASPASLLESYDREHQIVAAQRVATGRRNAELAAPIFRTFHTGGDIEPVAKACAQYGGYDGVIYGYELKSELCAVDAGAPPQLENEVMDYVPVVRSGRRAPNLWLDEEKTHSVLDWNGIAYTLMVGANVVSEEWQPLIDELTKRGFPIRLKILPPVCEGSPYHNQDVIVMRPDSIVADHWRADALKQPQRKERLENRLPLAV